MQLHCEGRLREKDHRQVQRFCERLERGNTRDGVSFDDAA